MKKLLGVLLAIIMAIFGFTACTSGNRNRNEDGNETGGEETGGSGETNNPSVTESSDILIAYFSCTNTTEAIAKRRQAYRCSICLLCYLVKLPFSSRFCVCHAVGIGGLGSKSVMGMHTPKHSYKRKSTNSL